MRSIGTRLAVWYAVASAATLTIAVVAGYLLLERHLVGGLDEVNRKEFQQLRVALRPDFNVLDPEDMADRLREVTVTAGALFYIEVGHSSLGTVFATENLRDKKIPVGSGEAPCDVTISGVGELRVSRFSMDRMTMLVGSSLAPVRQVLGGYIRVAAILTAAIVAISCGLGFGLSRAALRPVRAIQATAEHIGSDNLSERIPVGAVEDEISDLARLLNRTFDRLERAFNQVRRFAGEASHELKTPLALARAHAEKIMAAGPSAAGHDEAVQNVLEELSRLEKIIDELLLLSRAEAHAVPLELCVADPQVFVKAFVQDARVLGEYRGVAIEEICTGTGRVEFDPKWMRQVLLNLVTNALRASPRGSAVTIASCIDASEWRVSVEDDGPGVPAAELERIFERFFRLAPHGEDNGSGLGLAISRSIVALHLGRIRAELPEKGRGLRVVVTLPAWAAGRVRADGVHHLRAAELAS